MSANPDIRMGCIEIRPEDVESWRSWGKELMSTELREAIKSLEEEGLSQEHMSLVYIDDRPYLCYFSEGEHRPANLARPVNVQHRNLLDRTRVRKITGEIIYSLHR